MNDLQLEKLFPTLGMMHIDRLAQEQGVIQSLTILDLKQAMADQVYQDLSLQANTPLIDNDLKQLMVQSPAFERIVFNAFFELRTMFQESQKALLFEVLNEALEELLTKEINTPVGAAIATDFLELTEARLLKTQLYEVRYQLDSHSWITTMVSRDNELRMSKHDIIREAITKFKETHSIKSSASFDDRSKIHIKVLNQVEADHA